MQPFAALFKHVHLFLDDFLSRISRARKASIAMAAIHLVGWLVNLFLFDGITCVIPQTHGAADASSSPIFSPFVFRC